MFPPLFTLLYDGPADSARESLTRPAAGAEVMIEELYLENFKGIRKLKLKLRPLTIFIGPNGSRASRVPCRPSPH